MPIYIYIALVTILSCCCNIVCYYACCQQTVSILQIEPDWAYFYLNNIEFVLLLGFFHFFFLELAVASSGGWSMQGGICWT